MNSRIFEQTTRRNEQTSLFQIYNSLVGRMTQLHFENQTNFFSHFLKDRQYLSQEKEFIGSLRSGYKRAFSFDHLNHIGVSN